jgi:hypothetical protein
MGIDSFCHPIRSLIGKSMELSMPQPRRIIAITLLVIALTALTAYAGMHFVGSASFGFGSLDAQVNIGGFGNNTDTVTVTLSATGQNLTALCVNRGGKDAPGQNPVNVNVYQLQSVYPDHNGNAETSFHVNLLPSAVEAGCPNRNWSVTDLFGTLFVSLTANDTATGDTAVLNYVCVVDQANRSVNCIPS